MPYKDPVIRKQKARERWDIWAKRNRSKAAQRTKDWRNNNRNYWMWFQARKRAKEKGLEFNITVDDIVIPETCPVFDIPLMPNPKEGVLGNTLLLLIE